MSLSFFLVLALSIHYLLRSTILNNRNSISPITASIPTSTWQKHFFGLYLASCLILARSVFRVAEFGQGYNGAMMKDESLVFIFDGILMLTVLITFNYSHPGDTVGMFGGEHTTRGAIGLIRMDDVEEDVEPRSPEVVVEQETPAARSVVPKDIQPAATDIEQSTTIEEKF